MTGEDRAEIREIVREAIAAAFEARPVPVCPFLAVGQDAATVHELARRMTPEDIIAMAWGLKHFRAIADSIARWVARLVFLGLLTAAGIGVLLIALAIRKGWIQPPTP